jgi:eukaryotic-like serine/threonine-protein kinase
MQTVGGRYELIGRLGKGGMGEVYRARHVGLGKSFALKVIAPAFAGDSAARQRFNEEAKLASEISHPNIVSPVDFGEDPELGAYMVMEIVEGDPLLTSLSDGPMSVRRAIDVLAQVADALEHIHKRGIIHGDVKADNIMVVAEATGATGTRRRRTVRLLDFGLARRRDTQDDSLVSGSPHYFAPERAMGGQASVLTDVYALGVLGYLLFAGALPFDGTLMEILTGHVERVPDRLAQRRGEVLDDSIEALIQRALAKDPCARTPSASAFRYELNTVMDMLDMGRRRARPSGILKLENARDAALASLFERSKLPQAIVSVEGIIGYANKAFAKLVGHTEQPIEGEALDTTALVANVPGLLRAIRTVHIQGRPSEVRAQVYRDEVPVLELVIWLVPAPLPGEQVHLLIRVEELQR